MYDSPLAYCPRCRQYVALDCSSAERAARYQCGGGSCPLEPYFTGTQAASPVAPAHMDSRPGDLSTAATSLLGAIAACGQFEFSGADLERMLQKSEAKIGSIVDELRNRDLMRLAHVTKEKRGYELTAAGRRYILEHFPGMWRSTGGAEA